MEKFSKFMLGLVLGAIIGGGTSLLLAPYSGERLRKEIEQYYKQTTDDIRTASIRRRNELELQLEELRKPAKPELN